ncbi:GNAT family N-acetyltransferase [Chengkuizengella sediminis]|uniref:GNAT family N-acetyltransferase n=1 Tax=Chengkuizengella sediminis TaxID=1885917 RepID=UPI00138A5D26|nr:GNAT family N-acetyltransferase [Chengkuizengella sediminis]NDI33858.1 GNAT family N-acetyltransferase [Chengkuizengella sediminis]
MNQVYLSKPTVELEQEYLSFYQDWVNSGEKYVPFVIRQDPNTLIQFLLDSAQGLNIPAQFVPHTTYWLVRDEDKSILGAVNIRHQLNEKLLNIGGHIGYGICSSERRKGYATKMLALSLEKARELGIQKVLVTCDYNNLASKKTIFNNGGVPDTDYVEESGNIVNRFWIEL